MPEMSGKIIITGYAVPVDSCCVIDLTCRLARDVENVQEVASILRGSNTLKTLETVHVKCQPGWLLSQWCPENQELRKSELPRIDCITETTKMGHFGAQKCPDPSAEEEVSPEISREKKISRPTVASSLSLQSTEIAADIVHFWHDEGDNCVSKDVLSSDAAVTLDVHSCLSLPEGSLLKLVAW